MTPRALAEENARDAVRHFARHAPGAVLTEEKGVLAVLSATPAGGTFHAAVLRTDPTTAPASVIAAARRLATDHARDVTIWAAEDLDRDLRDECVAEMLTARTPHAGMSLAAPPEGLIPPPGIRVRRVATPEGIHDFAEIHRQNYRSAGLSPDCADHVATPGSLLDPAVDAFVAEVDGVPAACAMALVTGSVGGIYWVGTRPEFRRRGLGDLLSRTATRAAFGRGARLVVLQATASGESVYRRLGFTRFTTYLHYTASPVTAGS